MYSFIVIANDGVREIYSFVCKFNNSHCKQFAEFTFNFCVKMA